MKRKNLDRSTAKITSYRIYKRVVSIRGKRKSEWRSWQLEAENKVRKTMEKRMTSFTEQGTYRLARKRSDGSLEWIYEIAR